jgi:probable addiction module antidote protein
MVEIRKTEVFSKWLDGLRDIRARARADYSSGGWRQEHTSQRHQNCLAVGTLSTGAVVMTKTTITTRYDVAEHLRTPEEMAAYLEACFEEANGDAAFIAKALGDIARAKGMSEVARDAGLSRESLYKALSGERTPGFDTILKVMGALGLKLHAEAIQA